SPILPGLASTQVWVGNSSGVASAVSLSGDISSMTNAGVVTANKTTTAQANKLLSLDGSGVAATMGNQINGSNSGSVTLQAAAATTNYSLTFPAAQGSAGQILSNNGSGVLSWVTPLSSSTGFLNGGNSFGANSSLGNNDNFNLDIKTNNTSRMTILNTGNVGIGTANPLTRMDIDTPGVAAIENGLNIVNPYTSGTNSAATNLSFGYHSGASYRQSAQIQAGQQASGSFSNGYLGLFAEYSDVIPANPQMYIRGDGNVGIGTTSPGQKLDVSGNINVSGSATVGGSAVWTAGNLTNLSQLTNGPGYLTPGFASTSGQPASTALANEAGYGAFQAQAQGSGGSAGAAFMSFHRPGNYAAYFGLDTDNQFKVGGWSMGAASYAIIHTGNIASQSVNYANVAGTLVTNPTISGDLNVTGAVIAGSGNYYSGQRTNYYLSLQPDRNMVLYDGGAIWFSGTQVSDIRYKQNVRPLEEVLPILMQLDVIRFKYLKSIDKLQKPQIGVIAQEINKYFPELVYHDEKDDRYMVAYDKLTSLLIKGMQELKNEKDRQFNDLKLENAELRSALCEMNPRSKICNQH
ncbi:MAG: tail fiber domain-containing protein, partial [Pseudobdellovibrionaceae bacterium]